MTALHDLSADTLSSAYRAGQLSPVEVMRAALARIDAWEGKINAMHVITADEALAQAASAEARWRAGQGVKSAQEQEKHNVYRVDPKSGDIKVIVDDFVEPNGHCFRARREEALRHRHRLHRRPGQPVAYPRVRRGSRGRKGVEQQGFCGNARAQHH
jgi:hypothetical protein